jgi:hypothetical protein
VGQHTHLQGGWEGDHLPRRGHRPVELGQALGKELGPHHGPELLPLRGLSEPLQHTLCTQRGVGAWGEGEHGGGHDNQHEGSVSLQPSLDLKRAAASPKALCPMLPCSHDPMIPRFNACATNLSMGDGGLRHGVR